MMQKAVKVLPRPELETIKPYKVQNYKSLIKMDANESPFNIPEKISCLFIEKAGKLDYNRYPDPLCDRVRELLADKYLLKKKNFLVGNGGDEIIYYLLLSYGGLNRRAVSLTPTFSVYGIYSSATYTEFIEIERNDEFGIGREQFDKIIEAKPGIVFICNPNNPTGTELSLEAIDNLTENLPESLIIIDEAYGEFSGVNHAKLISKGNVAILKTFSKAFSLAGMRIGYIISSREIISNLIKVKLPYNVNIASQELAKICLENEKEFEQNVKELVSGRQFIFDELSRTEGVTPYPSGANYVFFKLQEDTKEIFEGLIGKGILVRPFFDDKRISNCLRVTVGTMEQNEQFLKGLDAELSQLKGK